MAAVIAALVLCPGAASAATVSVSDGALVIVDTVGEDNVLDVLDGSGGLRVYDDRAPPVAGDGCFPIGPKTVQCFALVNRVRADLGGGDDLAGTVGIDVPVEMSGGAGEDLLEAGDGSSVLDGGGGIDSLAGGDGVDRLAGDTGDDLLLGGKDADTMVGGQGDDILNGQAGSGDVALGGDGRDLLRGGEGADQLEGGAGDDVLIGGDGRDDVGTGTGSDVVFVADDARDSVDCRSGDRIRGEAKGGTSECGTLRPGVRRPRHWPPSHATASVITSPDPQIKAWLRVRGQASRYSVRVKADESYPLRVQVCTYNARKQRIRRFKKTVMTRHKRSYRHPAPRRKATYIRVRRARFGCR